MMHDQQKVCPHFVALFSLSSSQQILHSPFSFPPADPDPSLSFIPPSLPLTASSCLRSFAVRTAQRLLAILTAKVARRRQPSTLQLTSRIWSFLQVQAQLMPRRDSMKVKCLFQSSIYTIRISHSTLLITSSAPPSKRIAPALTHSHFSSIRWKIEKGGGFYEPGLLSSKARRCSAVSLMKRGRRRLRESSSRRKSRMRVFLLRRIPSSKQCFYLYMAMQVYSSPSLRRHSSSVTRLQYASGRAATTCERSLDCRMDLLAEEGRSSPRARLKFCVNLWRSLDYSSCSRRTSGLWESGNILTGVSICQL